MKIKTDIVVVGSGAGGATVAKELAKSSRDILVLERGPLVTSLGTQRMGLRFYDRCGLRTSREGVIVYRTLMVGGTTVVSCGNGIAVMEKELKTLGIDLSKELADTLRELNVQPLANHLIGKGSRLIMDIGNKFGLEMKPMPKYVNPKKCISCGLCTVGCKTGAKWSTIAFIEEMQKYGGRLMTNIEVKNILTNNGKVTGLIAQRGLEKITISANKIILAAGGFGTPIILKRSGIKKAGDNFFVDLLNVTYGVLKNKGINLYREPTMAVVSTKFLENKGFLISPFVDMPLVLRWIMPKKLHLRGYRHKNLIGIMTKIKDDDTGEIMENGRFHKTPTAKDWEKLSEGENIAKQILLEAGVSKKDIFTTRPRGAHPGGTAAIGKVVDTNLKTELDNLYVCDASVLPVSSGAPPIVTIVALGKRLSKFLQKYS